MGVVKNIINKIKAKLRIFKINNRIKKYKYIHLMFNDKFNKPFVDFLNKNFDTKEHLILCKRFFKEFPFPVGENVIEIQSLKNLNFNNNNICKIICHSLFDNELVEYLYSNKNILQNKAYWVIWGGDLYDAPSDEINDYVRSNFKGYINKNDENYTKNKYKISKNFIHASYFFPVTKDIMDNLPNGEKNYIKIQINNSCDDSTLKMLDILSKFRNENIRVATILSYGKLDYKDEIIKKGLEIFGDKFEYLEDFLPPEEFAKFLADNDILILNQDRQQGFGNTVASLYLGAKVYISSNVSTYTYLQKESIKIYNSDEIESMSFDDFIKNNTKINNKTNISKFINENDIKEAWKIVFESS